MTANETLRQAVAATGMTPADLAGKLQVDPKTVERWIYQGRHPYARTAHRVAVLVGVDVLDLWPDLFTRTRPLHAQAPAEPRRESSTAATSEIIAGLTPEDLFAALSAAGVAVPAGSSPAEIADVAIRGLARLGLSRARELTGTYGDDWTLIQIKPSRTSNDTPEMRARVGQTLRALMAEHCLTLTHLCRATFYDKSYLSRVLNGHRALSPKLAAKLDAVFDVSTFTDLLSISEDTSVGGNDTASTHATVTHLAAAR